MEDLGLLFPLFCFLAETLCFLEEAARLLFFLFCFVEETVCFSEELVCVSAGTKMPLDISLSEDPWGPTGSLGSAPRGWA